MCVCVCVCVRLVCGSLAWDTRLIFLACDLQLQTFVIAFQFQYFNSPLPQYRRLRGCRGTKNITPRVSLGDGGQGASGGKLWSGKEYVCVCVLCLPVACLVGPGSLGFLRLWVLGFLSLGRVLF